MKILLVGDGHSRIHEVTVAGAFRKLGHQVKELFWYKYFIQNNWLIHQLRRAQNKFLLGPQIDRINTDLFRESVEFKPDLIFVYRGTHVFPLTLSSIKAQLPNSVIAGYNNDDPFSPHYSRWTWRHFLKGIHKYDIVLAYRTHNLEDFKKAGARRVRLLRSWFVPDCNYPIELSEMDRLKYECDVVFVGHYEPDQRIHFLENIIRQGWKLRLFGPGYDWNPVIRRSRELANQIPVRLVWGKDYNKALCGARVALCFLSKLNRDTYTRRCFEIPATGVMLLSEYSEDLASLYQEGEEADFFTSEKEMLAKLQLYLNDESRRKSVAEAGFQRVYKDGHDVVSRMKQVLNWVDEIRKQKI